MSGTWATDWATNDVVTAAEFRKSLGCVADSTLGVSAASISLPSLPTTYAHMLIECYLRGDTAAATVNCYLRLNGDAGSNYDLEQLTGTGATAAAAEVIAAAQIQIGSAAAATAPANVFTVCRIDIPHYGNASNNKALVADMATKSGTISGSFVRYASAGFWRSSAAINQITILPASGNFVAGSRVSVYVMGS